MNKVFNQLNHSCPSCEGGVVTTRLIDDDFQYGEGAAAVMLHVTLPLRECKNCELQYFDEEAEEIRHDAVCKHLKILTPREITAIRQRYALSKTDFSSLIKVGRISLSRWESGALLQNSSSDNLLYLMGFTENMDRLKKRQAEILEPAKTERKPARKFKLNEEQLSLAAIHSNNFSLFVNCQ